MPAQKSFSSWLPAIIIAAVLLIILMAWWSRRQQANSSVSGPAADAAVAGDNSNLLLGNPTNAVHNTANPDNYLIDKQYYVESYNNSKGGPNWVSWHLSAKDLGEVGYQYNFHSDDNLPAGFTAITPFDYKNSGFDRGHNCPSGDRTATQKANTTTFAMDNIVPQAPDNNQNVWEHLERFCRDKAKAGNELYIITGNYGSGGTGKKGYKTKLRGGKLNVPAHLWKVVVILPEGNNDLARIDGNTRVIAIDTPNDNNVSDDWMDYITTVSQIEQRCKCNLLSALPAGVQQKLEGKKYSVGN